MTTDLPVSPVLIHIHHLLLLCFLAIVFMDHILYFLTQIQYFKAAT